MKLLFNPTFKILIPKHFKLKNSDQNFDVLVWGIDGIFSSFTRKHADIRLVVLMVNFGVLPLSKE